MTYALWPSALPQSPTAGQWSWSPQKNKISFQPEVGPSIDRKRTSSAVKIYSVGYDFHETAHLDIFESFFLETLHDGVDPFIWNDPIEGGAYLWKFAADDPPYQITAQRGNYLEVRFKLTRVSQWNG